VAIYPGGVRVPVHDLKQQKKRSNTIARHDLEEQNRV
jgi:hypothetical protein